MARSKRGTFGKNNATVWLTRLAAFRQGQYTMSDKPKCAEKLNIWHLHFVLSEADNTIMAKVHLVAVWSPECTTAAVKKDPHQLYLAIPQNKIPASHLLVASPL